MVLHKHPRSKYAFFYVALEVLKTIISVKFPE